MSDRLTPETWSFVLMGRSSVTVVHTCKRKYWHLLKHPCLTLLFLHVSKLWELVISIMRLL